MFAKVTIFQRLMLAVALPIVLLVGLAGYDLSARWQTRAEMAKLYLAWGKELEAKHQWGDAAAAYSKAQGLDPKGSGATEALAAHHYTLGKALEGQGKDGGPDFRRAVALKPDYAPARHAADDAATAGRPVWMLYTAAGAALLAMVLFAAGMMRRRA